MSATARARKIIHIYRDEGVGTWPRVSWCGLEGYNHEMCTWSIYKRSLTYWTSDFHPDKVCSACIAVASLSNAE